MSNLDVSITPSTEQQCVCSITGQPNDCSFVRPLVESSSSVRASVETRLEIELFNVSSLRSKNCKVSARADGTSLHERYERPELSVLPSFHDNAFVVYL